MTRRLSFWLILSALVVAAGLGVFAYLHWRPLSTANLLSRLPADDAAIVAVDFAALRGGGLPRLFQDANAAEEPEYRSFVEQSGFDYQRDLDTALISVHPSGVYFLLRGRFDWDRLARYVRRQGGRCDGDFCRVEGSRPERKISFFPLRSNLMALAVSQDDAAALALRETKPQGETPEAPARPVWARISPGAMKRARDLPPGMRMFARLLENAEGVVLAAGPKGGRVELTLEVACRSAAEAAPLASQLKEATALLGSLIARERKTPSPRDLSGILAAGVFNQDGNRVLGHWPVEWAFFETLAGRQAQ